MLKRIFFLPLILALIGAAAGAQERQEFAYGGDPLQRLDLYRAAQSTNAPIIVMLHGGAWRDGDKRARGVWQNKAAYWTARGYLFVSVNTRLLPDAHPTQQAQDLAAAMAFIQQNAARVGGNPDQIILMGHSAGAHVAALLATRNDLRRAAGVQPWAGTIVLDTAALDLETVMNDDPARLYLQAFGRGADYWRAASPLRHISRQEGPFLVVCSALRDDACPAAESFAQAAAAQRVDVTIAPQPLSHAQINRRLGQSSSYTATVDNWITSALQ
ncbi:alpha/beta hydrolase [Yoonia sp. BS5-3]|uniref:Alpha/beta hydrolase fold domain-containing protein n=1 Tax=Yoonia phaeophyticola TaxID=3137369 RepID=A0ABZ2V2I6_9RHOB